MKITALLVVLVVQFVFISTYASIILEDEFFDPANVETPVVTKLAPDLPIPLMTEQFNLKCPSAKDLIGLRVAVNERVTYHACYDANKSKNPLYTLHELQYDSNAVSIKRPEVEPWYQFDTIKNGNGRALVGRYDRGHFVPSADFQKQSEAMMKSTFFIFNRAPQVDTFNRGTWNRLESLLRTWSSQIKGECPDCQVKIITGISGDIGAAQESRGATLTIPKYYYKIVLVLKLDGAELHTDSYGVLFYGLNDIEQTRFPITIFGDEEDDPNSIPKEIMEDLKNTLNISDLLLEPEEGLLLQNGKTLLLNQLPTKVQQIQK